MSRKRELFLPDHRVKWSKRNRLSVRLLTKKNVPLSAADLAVFKAFVAALEYNPSFKRGEY
jgi:hypothetical protein